MKVPFEAIFIPTRTRMTVSAVTDAGSTRFYWVPGRKGGTVKIPSYWFAEVSHVIHA